MGTADQPRAAIGVDQLYRAHKAVGLIVDHHVANEHHGD